MLLAWASDPSGTPFYWLNGMAGTGKSTIAQSICNRLYADGMLGASFFCSRSAGGGRNDARRIVSTLAYQLAYHIEGFVAELGKVIRLPQRINQQLDSQLQQLLWEPLDNAFLASGSSWKRLPLIVVVDGLDECSDESAQDFVEALLLRFEHSYPIHLRFLLLSRCERHIGVPIRKTNVDVSRFQLQDVPRSAVNNDIRKYVEAGFVDMSRRKGWDNDWYKGEDIDLITAQADVLFVYAATVLKYLADSRFHPKSRLQIIRNLECHPTPGDKALRSLHLLYGTILQNLGEEEDLEWFEVELARRVLIILASSHEPVFIHVMADLLNCELREVRECILSLSSVVLVPSQLEEDFHPIPIWFLHASFPEFVLSSQLLPVHFRSHIGDDHRTLALRCIMILEETLQEGLLGKDVTRHTSRRDITPNTIPYMISPTLQYATRYWLMHLAKAALDRSAMAQSALQIAHFVNGYLLRWLECLAWTYSLDAVQETLDEPTTGAIINVCHFVQFDQPATGS